MAKNQNVDPNEEEREEMTVTLTLDDDTELECAVLTIFEAAGRDYIALLPLDGAEDEEGEVYLYRYSEVDGQPELDNIQDDDEYEAAADAFDEFLDGEYFKGSEQLRYYTSDQGDFEKLIQVVEEKEDPQEKLFLFNVTMQNHGGYEGTFDEFDQTVWLTGDMEGKYPKADQYLSLVKRSDEAFAYLLDYFSHSDEPTMIVMFGDHQPSVEDEFFDEIYGTPSYEVPTKDRLMWYETPFIIWTNYEQPSKDIGKLGAVYLSSYVLKLAGLDMTPYNRFLLDLSQIYPVLHFLGFYDKDGNYQSWSEAESGENPNRKQILDYEAMAYNHSIDRRKYKPLFTLEEEK